MTLNQKLTIIAIAVGMIIAVAIFCAGFVTGYVYSPACLEETAMIGIQNANAE